MPVDTVQECAGCEDGENAPHAMGCPRGTTWYPEPCQAVIDYHGNICGRTDACEHTAPQFVDVWKNAR